jgi:protein transport protein SEC24
LAKRYALPLGGIIQPLAQPGVGEAPTPVVNFGSSGIVRCRRCRSYISAWCRFHDGGRRWICCMCQYPNDVPSDYFCPLDQSGRRRDAAERPELHRGSIEFVAPAEYMVRPPMPPVYLFVIEVTPAAASSGALAAMISGIKLSIDALPQEGRTRVGIVTFDAAVHFYHLPAGEDADPSISTVADITEMFLPSPDGILGHLTDSRPALVKALDMIASTGKRGQANLPQQPRQPSALSAPSCLGAALQGAQKVMEHYGGKMVVLAASRPTVGPGALRDRDDTSSFFTDRERALLRSETTFYRLMGVEFSKFQISCDLFCCSPPPGSYMDIATVGQLAKITGGELFRASSFEAYRDHARLQRAVYRTLSRETGLEAVMRIRATKSIRCSHFHGRFFVRSTDLLAMPSVDCDKTYAVQFSFDESMIAADGPFCVQVALLYTTTGGERRIRVHTVASPVTNSMTDLFLRVDAPATANLFTRLAAEASKERVLDELKKNFADKVTTALAVYRSDCMQQYPTGIGPGGGSQQLFIPDAMNLLPLFMHGLLKTAFLSRDTAASFLHRIDDKSALLHAVDVMGIAQTTAMLYPNMISVLPGPALGVPNPSDSKGPPIPEAVAASMSSLKADVAVLVDDGNSLLLWLGASVVQSFAAELLDCPPQAVSAGVDPRQLAYKLLESVQLKGSAAYVRAVIKGVAALRPAGTPLYVIPAGSPMQARLEALCVEDRTAGSMGYKEFLTEVQRQVTSKSSSSK